MRQKEVINVKDGKKLGRVCDVVFTFPEGRVLGIVVPGGKGFFRAEMFIDLRNVIKIGIDTVLVEVRPSPKVPPKRGHGYIGRGACRRNDCDDKEDRDDCDDKNDGGEGRKNSDCNRYFEDDE